MNTLRLQFLILIIAGWVNRTQQDVIEYLQAENRVLCEQLGDGRTLFTDRQRLPRRRTIALLERIGSERNGDLQTRIIPCDVEQLIAVALQNRKPSLSETHLESGMLRRHTLR